MADRALARFLYGVRAAVPQVCLEVALLWIAVAACLLPAMRAARVAPQAALREEG
jgi:hypothetical protein